MYESDFEERRQQLIVEQDDDPTDNWRERFAPGSFGCHELLDRVHLLTNLLDEAVVQHPACILNAEWFALASQAEEVLNDLYQKVGAAH